MDRGLYHRCTSSWDGQDQLEGLAMETTTQETAGKRVLATSRTERLKGKKNRMVQNLKPDGPISPKRIDSPGQPHKQ
jgi:hypothetical protein